MVRRLHVVKNVAASILLATLSLLPMAKPVAAQSNGLGVRPIVDVTVSAGDQVQETAFINNPSAEDPLTVGISMVDFTSKDETGGPQFLPPTERAVWSARDFINIEETATIAPNESLTLPFTITVPADQGAGTYYTALRYSTVTDTSGGQVGVTASNTTLVFVRVPGDAKELMNLEQFGAFEAAGNGDTGAFKSFFTSQAPQRLAYRLKNEGDVAEQAKGTIQVTNVFGKEVVKIRDANPGKELALRGQTRRIDLCMIDEVDKDDKRTGNCVQAIKMPGRYTATMTLFYGENGSESREITAKTSFWYLPAWFIIASIIIVGLIVLGIVFAVLKIRNSRYGNGSSHRR